MENDPKCPECTSENTYFDGNLWVCPECAHEWNPNEASQKKSDPEEIGALVIKDAHGNLLSEGDSVTVIKDLKVKGSSSVVKVGTKVRNIHLVESSDGHNIACRIDGIGQMNLKSEFVKKA